MSRASLKMNSGHTTDAQAGVELEAHAEVNIPLIDLSVGVAWRRARHQRTERVANRDQAASSQVRALSVSLCEALREVGVVYITRHGVPRGAQEALKRSAQRFFALPDHEKRAVEMKRAGRAWRGYFAEGAELTSGRPDYKEGLYLGEEHSSAHPLVQRGAPMHGANLWPDHPAELREDVTAYMSALSEVATLLIELISLGLGLEYDELLGRFTDAGRQTPTQLFRIFHYPRHAWGPDADEWGVRAHTDMGFLTVLLQDQEGGLQAQLRSGEWVDVPPLEDTFVVNIGDMLELWTWGHLRATLHRVKSPAPLDSPHHGQLNTPEGPSAGRLSFPFFFDPAWDAPLTRLDRDALPELNAEPERNAESELNQSASARWDGLDLSRLSAETTYGAFVWSKVSRVFPELAESAVMK